jgi:predicted RNase H-like nuclease (RuvC/YqgF family)
VDQWRYWDKKGNLQATAIIDACIREAIERRADEAFGVYRSTEEYNQRIEAAKAISYDSVALLRQVQQLIEMIRANIQSSQALNRTIHTLMHNQTTSLRSAHDQACALLEIIRLSEESEGKASSNRIEEMKSELQTLDSEIQLLTSKIEKLLPPEGQANS